MKQLEDRPSRLRPGGPPSEERTAWDLVWAIALPLLLFLSQVAAVVLAGLGVRFDLAGILVWTGLCDLAVAGFAWLVLSYFPGRPSARLGLQLPPRRRDLVLLPIAGLVLSAAGIFLADLIYGFLSGGARPPAQKILDVLGVLSDPALRVLAFAVVAVVAPICEEIIFRGALFRSLRRRMGTALAAILSAVVFSLAHTDPAHALHLFAIGLVLAGLVALSDSLLPGMILHALLNGGALVLSWTTGS